MLINIEKNWRDEQFLKTAFDEYTHCIKAVFKEIESVLKTPPQTPMEFEVSLGQIPDEFYSLRKNLFSTLFQSVYHILKIDSRRRLLYGKINHLFRIWVTSADNLLDNEDKIVIPIEIAGSSRVMRQVISIMTADRVLKIILDQAVRDEIINAAEADLLSRKSLQILLPSAAEEASEENGINHRPTPDYVLRTIHRLKTGLLFHVPFLGPENIEPNIDPELLEQCKEGLMNFGLGCQILDDIRDIAKDHIEKRQNYILSMLYADSPRHIEKLQEIETEMTVDSNVFGHFGDTARSAGAKALELLSGGLMLLGAAGLGINRKTATFLGLSMFDVLGVGELASCL